MPEPQKFKGIQEKIVNKYIKAMQNFCRLVKKKRVLKFFILVLDRYMEKIQFKKNIDIIMM